MRGNSQKKRVINLFLFAVSLFIFCGCGAPIKIKDLNMDSYSTKIPLKIGLYIPSAFRNYVKVINLGAANSVAVGDALTIGAEQAFKEIYEDVVILDESSSDIISKDVYVIISPEIVDISSIWVSGFYGMRKFDIICKWTIVSPSGKILYLNTIKGTGSDNTRYAITLAKNIMTFAVEDHYKKLVSHMLSTKWWENIH